MDVTEVRILILKQNRNRNGRLKAFCSATFDSCFVVRDIRVVARDDGSLFVAMPSRPRLYPCPECATYCPFNHHFCHYCASRLPPVPAGGGLRDKYADIAHPVGNDCRYWLEDIILKAYKDEVAKPGSVTALTRAYADAVEDLLKQDPSPIPGGDNKGEEKESA